MKTNMIKKKCTKCGETKYLEDFYKQKGCKDNLRPECKTCRKKYNLIYYKKNLKKIKRIRRKWRNDNVINIKINRKIYYQENKEKDNTRSKKYYYDNKEKSREVSSKYYINNINKIRKQNKEWRTQNREKYNNYQNTRNLIPKNKLSRSMRTAIWDTLKKNKNDSWTKIVGYSVLELMKHIEKKFIGNMSWKNYGKWHIDHVIPISWWSYKNYKY